MGQKRTVGETSFQFIEVVPEMWSLRDEDGLVVAKLPDVARRIEALLDGERIETMVEVGIHRGGSTAYFFELLAPRCLVALDIEERDRAERLERWIDEHGRRGRIETFYGVDQADTARLDEICRSMFGNGLIDLIEDDASHQLDATRTTFNALFPRLRTGGLYIIEDWAWREWIGPFVGMLPPDYRDVPPLSHLVHELVTASVKGRGIIDDILVNDGFAAVRRGAAPIAQPFDIAKFA